MPNQLIANIKSLDYAKPFLVTVFLTFLVFLDSLGLPFKDSYILWAAILSFSGSIFFIGKLLGFAVLDGLYLYLSYFICQLLLALAFFKILKIKMNKIILIAGFFSFNFAAYWLAWFIPSP